MSESENPQPGDSMFGVEYPSALAALEDREIFAIAAIAGGFEIREKGRNENFVRLLPEQLRELGEELIALAAASPAPAPEPTSETAPAASTESAPATRGHTITIPSGIWDARVTQQFQERIARLEQAEAPAKPATRPIKPWIKP